MLEEPRAVEIRIVHVRDESSRWPSFATVLLASLAMFVLGGHFMGRVARSPSKDAPSEESRLRKLTIVDREGCARIVMSAADGEGANLVFYGASDRKPRVVIHSYENGVDGITVYDPVTGSMRLSLGIGPDGNPMQLMYDEDSQRKLAIGVLPQGSPLLRVSDQTCQSLAKTP